MALPSWYDFLDRLQRDGVIRRLDPRTMQAVEELLDAGLAHAPAELSAALASLLATTPEQWRQVETRFRAFLAAPADFLAGNLPVEEPPPVPTKALELRLEPSLAPTNTHPHRWLQWLATRRAVGSTLLVLAVAFSLGLAAGIIAIFRSVDVALQTPAPELQETPATNTPPPKLLVTPLPPDAAPSNTTGITGQATTSTPDPVLDKKPEQPAPTTATTPASPPPSTPSFTIALMFFSAALVAVGLRWLAAPRAQRRRAGGNAIFARW